MAEMPLILPEVRDDLKASPRRSQSCCQCVVKVQDRYDVLCQRPSPWKGAESFHKNERTTRR